MLRLRLTLSETDTTDWSIFPSKTLKQFDSENINIQTKAVARSIQLATHESISMYVCRVDDLVNKKWPEVDPNMRKAET